MKSLCCCALVLFMLLTCVTARTERFSGQTLELDSVFVDLGIEFVEDFVLIGEHASDYFGVYESTVFREKSQLYMYIIFSSNSIVPYDYVFFDEPIGADLLFEYFLQRWIYLSNGMRKGFIHFEENPIPYFRKSEVVFGLEEISEGSMFGNKHFSKRRLLGLEQLIEIMRGQKKGGGEIRTGQTFKLRSERVRRLN